MLITIQTRHPFLFLLKTIQALLAKPGEPISVIIKNGIDTPELRNNRDHIKQLARLAKQHTVQRLREARKIELRNMKRGKYFRIVADVFVDGEDLGQELIQKGLAKPYDGGKKTKWL